MKQTETKQNLPADTELDAVLAQMAEEVPPMPADFHARWMNAVRAESGPAEEKTPGRAGSIVLWTRILSVAAAFVFLIGGTLLYRNSRRSLDAACRAGEKNTEITVYEETAAGEAPEAAAGMDAAAPEADAGIFMGLSALKESETREAYAVMAEEAAVTESEEEEPAEEEDAEGNALPADEEPEEEPDEETAGETAEQEGFLQAAGRFFTDMGDFLLAALPYLLVLAVPAAAALIIRKRKMK